MEVLVRPATLLKVVQVVAAAAHLLFLMVMEGMAVLVDNQAAVVVVEVLVQVEQGLVVLVDKVVLD